MSSQPPRHSNFFIFFVIGVVVWMVALVNVTDKEEESLKKLDTRISKAERTLVMLHTCYPNNVYKADAAPECPAFKDFVTNELNKNEATFKEGN